MTQSSESDLMACEWLTSMGLEQTLCSDDLNRSAPLLWHLLGSHRTEGPLKAVMQELRLCGHAGSAWGALLAERKEMPLEALCFPALQQ